MAIEIFAAYKLFAAKDQKQDDYGNTIFLLD